MMVELGGSRGARGQFGRFERVYEVYFSEEWWRRNKLLVGERDVPVNHGKLCPR